MEPVSGALEGAISSDEVIRVRHIQARWDAYMGNLPKPLRVTRNKAGQPIDDNVILPLARIIVDKGRSALFGEEIHFETDDERVDDYLHATWSSNRQSTLLQNLALNGAIAGHAYLRLHTNDPYPRITVLDPATVRVFWSPDDIAVRWRYRIEYVTQDMDGKAISRRQDITDQQGSWLIEDYVGDADRRGFRKVAEDVWRFPFAPIVDCQNLPAPGMFYGLSDLEPSVLDLAKGINRTVSNLQRILRYHAHPKTIAKGMSPDDLRVGVDDVLFIPDSGTLENLEMTSDLNSSMQFYERLMDALFETARIPQVARGKLDNAGSLSGVALRILYQPLLEQTSDKRRLYGDALIEVNRRMAIMGGFGERQVTLHWPELVPTDPMIDANVALALKDVGVSTATLLSKLGFDPMLEAEKKADEAAGDYPDPLSNLAASSDDGSVDDDINRVARQVDAAAVLIRSGFDPQAALRAVGLDPIRHLKLLPITVKTPEA